MRVDEQIVLPGPWTKHPVSRVKLKFLSDSRGSGASPLRDVTAADEEGDEEGATSGNNNDANENKSRPLVECNGAGSRCVYQFPPLSECLFYSFHVSLSLFDLLRVHFRLAAG